MNRISIPVSGGVLGLGGGIVLNIYWPNLLWLGWALIGLGILGIILGLKGAWATRQWRRIKAIVIAVFKVVTRIKESNTLLTLKDEQQKHPEKWLYLVILRVDLGTGHDANDIYIKFQIDSHLLFPINEFL